MKKILLVSGCSFTDKNFISDFHPDLLHKWPTWPELLAKKLDMEVINLGKMGAGNEYIYSSLLDKIMTTDNIGLIMAAWSQSQRRDWKVKRKWFNNSWYCNTDWINQPNSNDMYAYIDKSLRQKMDNPKISKNIQIKYQNDVKNR